MLSTILWVWGEWSNIDEPKAWVENLVQSNAKTKLFLMGVKNVCTSTTGQTTKYLYYMNNSTLNRYITPVLLDAAVVRLLAEEPLETLTKSEQLAVRAFLQAKHRRENGLPDDMKGVEESVFYP